MVMTPEYIDHSDLNDVIGAAAWSESVISARPMGAFKWCDSVTAESSVRSTIRSYREIDSLDYHLLSWTAWHKTGHGGGYRRVGRGAWLAQLQ
jgi:hypothetical protein